MPEKFSFPLRFSWEILCILNYYWIDWTYPNYWNKSEQCVPLCIFAFQRNGNFTWIAHRSSKRIMYRAFINEKRNIFSIKLLFPLNEFFGDKLNFVIWYSENSVWIIIFRNEVVITIFYDTFIKIYLIS